MEQKSQESEYLTDMLDVQKAIHDVIPKGKELLKKRR